MSIQITRSKKLIHRVQTKLRVDSAYDFVLEKYQNYLRNKNKYINPDEIKVYYHPYSLNTHPYIKERMYGDYAPVKWVNFKDANVSHYLQQPENISKPYFIEPNDQILTPGVFFNSKTPFEIIKRIDDIKELISSKNFKGMLIGDDGLEDQYKYYFGQQFLDKLYKYQQMRCIPRLTSDELINKHKKTGLNFLFLASDYKLKAVDILIKSWIQVQHRNEASLTIACPNIPKEEFEKISKIKSIIIIKEAPLSTKTKKLLLSNAKISISLTHVDGGANAFEGIEYGHPIITNSFHRSSYLIKNNNGVIIDFPNEFYRIGEYGIRFNSIKEYMLNIDSEIRKGKYDSAVQNLTDKIQEYIDNKKLLLDHACRSLQLAHEQSVERSNERLIEIYSKALAEK